MIFTSKNLKIHGKKIQKKKKLFEQQTKLWGLIFWQIPHSGNSVYFGYKSQLGNLAMIQKLDESLKLGSGEMMKSLKKKKMARWFNTKDITNIKHFGIYIKKKTHLIHGVNDCN